MAARLSLAEQLAQLDSAAPIHFDPENAENPLEDNENDLTAGRDHYVDVGPSTLRKAHDSILDPKYGGHRTSRRQLMDQEEDEDMDSDISEEQDNQPAHADEDHEADEENEEQSPPPRRATEQDDDLQSTLKRTRDHDRQKGLAVTQQLSTWDSLLDARIRMQKSITAANRIPPSLDVSMQSSEEKDALEKMLQEALSLSEEIFDLQETMLASSLSDLPPRKRRRVQDDDDIKDFEAYLQEATGRASAIEQKHHPDVVTTLTKWSAKIQAVAPSVLLPSNRNTFSKNSQNLKSAVQLIDEGLQDHGKLLQRTQIWRGKGGRLGPRADAGGEDSHDPEIFDDTDFYQQLLRDVIDSKNGTAGTDDWIIAQKQRKAKKKVDTKASKGRKIRYDVHEKLQSFMVPINVQGAWHEQQVDELFASLLGLGADAIPEDEVQAKDSTINDAIQAGFRVFG